MPVRISYSVQKKMSSSLRAGIVAAAPISPDKVKAIREKFNINLFQAFGTSETATTTIGAFDDPEEKILSTLGRPVRGVELKIVNENRLEVPAGEIVCAVIKLLPGERCTEQEVLDYLKSKIATYKLPNRILFTDEFPLTASGKIQKVKMKEMILKETNSLV